MDATEMHEMKLVSNDKKFTESYVLERICLDELKKTTQILSQKTLGCKSESVPLD
jgi:hypothetical protein